MKWDHLNLITQEVFDVVAVLQWVACQVRSQSQWRRKGPTPPEGPPPAAAWLDSSSVAAAPSAPASSPVAAAPSAPVASSSVPAASSVPAESGEMSADEMLQALDPVVCLALIGRWNLQLSEFSGCLIEACGRQTTGTFHWVLKYIFIFIIDWK